MPAETGVTSLRDSEGASCSPQLLSDFWNLLPPRVFTAENRKEFSKGYMKLMDDGSPAVIKGSESGWRGGGGPDICGQIIAGAAPGSPRCIPTAPAQSCWLWLSFLAHPGSPPPPPASNQLPLLHSSPGVWQGSAPIANC